MEQVNIKSVPVLLGISIYAIGAAEKYGVELELTRNTAVRIKQERTALSSACAALETGKATLAKKREVRDELLVSARAFTALARDVLRPHLGRSYSTNWNAAGFYRSLQVPVVPSVLVVLLEQLGSFLKSNPAMEVPKINVTAVYVKGLQDELSLAQNAVKNWDVTVRNLTDLKEEKFRILRTRIRHLVKELSQLMDPNDGRWAVFGLKIPGVKRTPPAPENVSVERVNETMLRVKWDKAPRAEYYRVRAKLAGAEETVLIESSGDPWMLLDLLKQPELNSVEEFEVSAVNRSGESRGAVVLMPLSKVEKTNTM